MGVNLVALRSLPGSSGSSRSPRRPPGSSGRPVRPSGSSGCLVSPSGSAGCSERRSTPSRQDLVVSTHKYRGQSARMHKTAQNKFQLTTKASLISRS